MPKLPRIGSRECLAALQRLGFVVARQRGSHIVLRPGTLSDILKQAGVSVEELIDQL
jgi:predicted RNA binding protein YcfA (HicA-like mRNA interferase family)